MPEGVNSRFKNWYERHGAAFNAERRARYKNDPQLRRRAQEAATRYRTQTVLRGEEPERREGLWTTAGVAYQLGVSPQTLRNWEARGLIPKATHGGKHRLYSIQQVQLLASFHSWLMAKHDHLSDYVFAHWNDL